MMSFLFRMSIFLLVLSSGLVVMPSKADNKSNLPQYSQKFLDEGKPLKIAVADSVIPFQFVDKGEPTGFVIDIWKLWAEKNKTEIEFVLSDWDQSLVNVTSGKADVHGALTFEPSRDSQFDFAGEIYRSPIYLYLHKDTPTINTPSGALPYIVGYDSERKVDQALTAVNSDFTLKGFENWSELYSAIVGGDIKAFVAHDYFTYRYPGFKTLNDLFPSYKAHEIDESVSQIAVKKGNSELLKFIESGFANIPEEEMMKVRSKWFGRVKGDNTILLGLTVGAEPFMGVNSKGEAEGLFVDIWKEWAKKTGNKIKFMPNTMELALQAVRLGETDIHIGFPESLGVNSGLPRAKHLYSTYSSLFVYDTYDFNQGVNQLDGKTIGMYLAAPYQKRFALKYPNINIKHYLSLDEAINASIKGEISGFVTSSMMTKLRLEQNNISHRFHQVLDVNYESNVYALLSPESKSLITEINNGFESISKETFIDIESRWVKDPDARYFSSMKSEFILDASEKNWIAEHPEMDVAIVQDWKPYEFLNEDGEIAGISRDIFEIAEKVTGQNYNFVVYPTWEELYQNFVTGKIDIVANITASEQRKAFANFTSAYWRTPWSVITHKSIDNVSTIKKFYGKRIAIIQGYQIIKEIHDKHPQVIIHVVKDFDEAHELLKAGIIDGILDLMFVSSQYIQDHSLYQFKIHVLDDMGSDNAHIGINKDLVIQARILDKVVNSLSESDIETLLKKWHKVDMVSGIKAEVYFRNITIVIGLGALILAVVLMWNRKLKSEILLREQAEKKLKHLASHDVLTGLPNRALLSDRLKHAIEIHARNHKQLALLFLDLDGFKQINDTYGHDVGDELLIQVGNRLSKLSRSSDTVARFGGDEFVLLVTNLADTQLAAKISEKIIADLCEPFELSQATVTIGCSIGIGCFPVSGHNINRLIKSADDAMYKVKANGKNSYAFA